MSKENADVISAKVKIKEWEKQFISLNLRVPESGDIKTAPDEVRAAYVFYFKFKKQCQRQEAEAKDLQLKNGEVWGAEFNVKQATPTPIRSAQDRFVDKMRSKLQPDGLPWKNSLSRLNRAVNGTPNKSSSSIENTVEKSFMEPASKKPLSNTEAKGKEPTSPLSSDIPSPVKDRKLSYRPVFRNRNLDPDWLARNANIPVAPVPLVTASSEIPFEAPKENDAQIIKLSQIHAFSKIIRDMPEIDEAICSAKKSIAETTALVEESAMQTPCRSVVTFEEEFSKEMKGRSDVANVRRMKSDKKFGTSHTSGNQEEPTPTSMDEPSGSQKVTAHSSPDQQPVVKEQAAPRQASRSILDPFNYQESETLAQNGSTVQLHPKEMVRTSEVKDSEVKTMRRRGGRIGAKIDADLELKPKRVKGKSKVSATKIPTNRKRKRDPNAHLEEPEPARGCEEAEGKIGHHFSEAEAEPKNPAAYFEDCSRPVQAKRPKTTSIERRIANGTLNDNFVKANLRKKTFARGVKRLNFKKYKFEQWKQAKQSQGDGGGGNPNQRMKSSECFKCGGFGHWAKYCFAKPKTQQQEEEPAVEIHIPTLSEVAAMVKSKNSQSSTADSQKYNVMPSSQTSSGPLQPGAVEVPIEDMDDSQIEDLMSQIPEQPKETQEASTPFEPFAIPDRIEPTEIKGWLRELGFEQFRAGQESVVQRILQGKSTLMVSSTGSGKSLCYQLPAYIFAQRSTCITLVVSPLISLMEDQVTGLPGNFKATYLHSGMAKPQKDKALQLIREGKIHAVLVSPEAVVAAGQGGSLLSELPTIAFACIDEAHCLSEWSHNFRPSYLQLYKTLREKMGIQCVLALTATATKTTCENIAQHLDIDSDGVVGLFKLPPNLVLTASEEVDRDTALLNLLRSDRFSECPSIIVYTTRRDETERLASLIRTSMQDKLRTADQLAKLKSRQRNKTRDVLEWDAEAYHAGLGSAKRKSVQNKFMKGKVRVVVATVAFGMGIDKPDIRAIIHYNMPKSFENYVQEAGRAGRDGKRSDCHLFLEFKAQDRNEIKRHIYTDSTDRFVIRKFLQKVFEPMERLKDALGKLPRFEVALEISQIIEYLDMKEEAILTLMCFLESHPKKFIQMKQRVYGTCTVKCYGGPNQFAALLKSSPPLVAAVALKKKFGELDKESSLSNSFTFPVVETATFMGWDSKQVKRELKNLEWNNVAGSYRKSGVVVELSDLCFHLYVSSDLGNLDQDEVLEYLFERTQQQEKLQLERLAKVFSAFKHVALKPGEGGEEVDITRSDTLKRIVEAYFYEEPLNIEIDKSFNESSTEFDKDHIRGDIRSLIHSQPDQTFSGRAVARIFHGIPSPNYPAQVWGRLKGIWRSHLEVDFPSLVKIANEEIVTLRTGRL